MSLLFSAGALVLRWSALQTVGKAGNSGPAAVSAAQRRLTCTIEEHTSLHPTTTPNPSSHHGGATSQCVPITNVSRGDAAMPSSGCSLLVQQLTSACVCLLWLALCRVLTAIKERYSAAKTGHDLLKRKSDAIKVNLNNILKKILVVSRAEQHSDTSDSQPGADTTVPSARCPMTTRSGVCRQRTLYIARCAS